MTDTPRQPTRPPRPHSLSGVAAAALGDGQRPRAFEDPVAVLAVRAPAQGTSPTPPAGSGIIAVPWRTITTGMLLVYYEPPHAKAPGTFADRVSAAHARAWREQLSPDAPGVPSSHHVSVIRASAAVRIGVYVPTEGTITLCRGAGEPTAQWLGLSATEVVNGELTRQLAVSRRRAPTPCDPGARRTPVRR